MNVRGLCWCWCWWSCWWCGTGFVLLSSSAAAAGSARQLEPGVGLVYQLTSTLLLSEPSLLGPAKDVGYQITADVTIGTVWASGADLNNKLIQVEVSFTPGYQDELIFVFSACSQIIAVSFSLPTHSYISNQEKLQPLRALLHILQN